MPVKILAKILAILHENSTAFSVPPDKYHSGISNGPRPLPSQFFLPTIYQSFYNHYYMVQNSNIIIQRTSQIPESPDRKGTTLQVIPNVLKICSHIH